MFALTLDPAQPKAAFYADLAAAAEGLVAGEADPVANMANLAALLWLALPDLNWAGFYRAGPDGLVLGPFQGKPACIRIAYGQGVCGTAAARGKTIRVDDVHAFPGHIACDSASAAELVVPVHHAGHLIAVIDLDSPTRARFDDEDARGIAALAGRIAAAIAG